MRLQQIALGLIVFVVTFYVLMNVYRVVVGTWDWFIIPVGALVCAVLAVRASRTLARRAHVH